MLRKPSGFSFEINGGDGPYAENAALPVAFIYGEASVSIGILVEAISASFPAMKIATAFERSCPRVKATAF
jgi:hypothetical protein